MATKKTAKKASKKTAKKVSKKKKKKTPNKLRRRGGGRPVTDVFATVPQPVDDLKALADDMQALAREQVQATKELVQELRDLVAVLKAGHAALDATSEMLAGLTPIVTPDFTPDLSPAPVDIPAPAEPVDMATPLAVAIVEEQVECLPADEPPYTINNDDDGVDEEG